MQPFGAQPEGNDNTSTTIAGTWKDLASYDEAAPPGRARLYLETIEGARKVHAALHGQVLQVRSDWLSITVHNDMLDADGLSGVGRRVR